MLIAQPTVLFNPKPLHKELGPPGRCRLEPGFHRGPPGLAPRHPRRGPREGRSSISAAGMAPTLAGRCSQTRG